MLSKITNPILTDVIWLYLTPYYNFIFYYSFETLKNGLLIKDMTFFCYDVGLSLISEDIKNKIAILNYLLSQQF